MFLPLFIAILLGLATPANTNHDCHNNGGTTVNTNGAQDDPGTDPGDGGDTGGENGHLPPPKIGD